MLIISLTLVFILAYNYTISATVSRINSTLDVLYTSDNGIPEEIPQLPNPLLHIEIEDNGSGMNEDTLRALKDGTIGYGLSNVRKRLAIFPKGAGAFEIFSQEGFGTCIAISIPAGISEAPPNTP